MAKKFFYNRVYNTRRTIINVVIIGACVIGIIICLLLTRNFQAEDHTTGNLNIKKEATVEVNETFGKEIYFSKIENVKLDNIEVKYPDDYDISKVGSYNVKVIINDKDYEVILKVIDTKKPELVLKEVKIKEGESYSAKDFVSACTDNSNEECNIEFYKGGVDEDGQEVDYSKYTAAGIYAIKISAFDKSENQMVEETKLTITANSTTPVKPDTPVTPVTPTTCKYGNNDYDKENYLIAVDITTNGCAVSLDLYKDKTTAEEINKLMDTETIKIKKEVEALNLTGTLALNRKVTAIVNKSGDGIVGYELRISVNISNNGNTEQIVDYKVNSRGTREYILNTYNLAK